MNVPIIPLDKSNHYFYGTIAAGIALVVATLAAVGVAWYFEQISIRDLWMVPFVSPVVGAFAVGVEKELRDRSGSGTPELADLAYTTAGSFPVVTGVALGELVMTILF